MSISRRDFFKKSLVAGAGAAAATMISKWNSTVNGYLWLSM